MGRIDVVWHGCLRSLAEAAVYPSAVASVFIRGADKDGTACS